MKPQHPAFVANGGVTKGATFRAHTDAKGAHDGPSLSARMIERMADEEYERRTWNGWSRDVCGTCHMALAGNGTCVCRPDDGRTSAERLLASLGL